MEDHKNAADKPMSLFAPDDPHDIVDLFDKDDQWFSEIIKSRRKALASIPVHARESRMFCELSELTYFNYRRTGLAESLDDSIRFERSALEYMSSGIQHSKCLLILGELLYLRFRRKKTVQDMAVAVTAGKQNVYPLPTNITHTTENRGHGHKDEGFDQAATSSGLVDLDEAIAVSHTALQLLPDDYPLRAMWLGSLGPVYLARYYVSKAVVDIDKAIELCETNYQDGNLDHSCTLIESLLTRFSAKGDESDAIEAIRLSKKALSTSFGDRKRTLQYLAEGFLCLYRSTGMIEHLDKSIDVSKRVTDMRGNHQSLDTRCSRFRGGALYERYQQTGSLDDLNESIALAARVAGILYTKAPKSKATLFSIMLSDWYAKTETTADSTQFSEALEWPACIPLFGTSRIDSLHELYVRQFERYERRGSKGDLDDVVQILRQMLDMMPSQRLWACLSHRLMDLYSEFHFPYQLLGATEILRRLVEESQRSPDHKEYSLSLALSLSFHHELTGDTVELSEAIEIGTRVFESTREDGKVHSLALNHLSEIYFQRCRVVKTLPNVEQTIDLLQNALDSGSEDHALSMMVGCLLWKYRMTDDTAYLDTAVQLGRQAVGLLPDKHPHRHSIIRHRLAISLHQRYLRKPTLSDVKEAIELERQNLDTGQKTRLLSHANLTSLLCELYIATGFREHLEQSIEMAWETTNLDNRFTWCFLGDSGHVPSILYTEQAKQVADGLRIGLGTMEHSDPRKACYLSSLALMLTDQDEGITSIRDAREALELVSEDDPNFPWHLCCVVLCLDNTFTRKTSELEEMISLAEQAADLSSCEHAGRPFYLTALSIALHWRFKTTGRSSDLDQAIMHGVEAYKMTGGDTLQDHHNRYLSSYHLSLCLKNKYLREGFRTDLEQSEELHQEALDFRQKLTQDGAYYNWLLGSDDGAYSVHLGTNTSSVFELSNKSRVQAFLPDKSESHPRIFSLAEQYFKYYQRTSYEHYLGKAINLCRSSLAFIYENHKEHTVRLHLLGRCYEEYYNRSLSCDCDESDKRDRNQDLSMAISTFRDLTNKLSSGDTLRADTLYRLGHLCSDKLHYGYELEDLKIAVEVHQECLSLAPKGTSDHALWLRHLGCSKTIAYWVFRNQDDLFEALDLLEQAKKQSPEDQAFKRDLTPNIASAYRAKFETTKNLRDIDNAIEIYHDAEDLYSSTRGQSLMQTWLGQTYVERYAMTKATEDFNQAISRLKEALTLTTKFSEVFERIKVLNSLTKCHLLKHHHSGSLADLKSATAYAKIASETTLLDGPQHQSDLGLLGFCYKREFEVTGREEHLLLAIESDERDFWHSMSSASIPESLEIAQRLLTSYITTKNWQRGFKTAEHALEIIPRYAPRYLRQSEAQALLSKISGVASLAAAFALEIGNHIQETLGMLERGRGVVADFLYDLRIDVDNQKFTYLKPGLKENFMRSLGQLQNSTKAAMGLPSDQTESGFRKLTEKIEASRSLDQFIEGFNTQLSNYRLAPRNANFSVFTKNGPIVVINVSYRCDAFLIRNMIEVLPLPKLSQKEIQRKLREGDLGSTRVLEWLWDAITGPILDELGYTKPPTDAQWPQVCWITTGALSRFPLHAAGHHTDGSGRAVLDRVMSSYSSSFKVIMEGPRKGPEASSTKAVMVAMQNTPGSSSNLPSAPKEVSIVRELCESMALEPVEPARFTKQVLSELKDCQILHFAGHGETDETNPLKSQLRLEDWQTEPLTVEDLLNLNLRDNPPFLAYLSACGTSQIKDERLLDESLHLISACQLAGFRHVIGTLWEVSDEVCVEVAEAVYREIRDAGMEDGSVCRGLHKAVRRMRDSWLAESRKATAQRSNLGLDRLALRKICHVERDSNLLSEVRLARDIVSVEDDEDLKPALWVAYVYYGSR